MNLRAQRIGIWGGVASIVLFAIGWVVLLGFIPPLAPTRSATSIAAYYEDHRTGIRFGALLMFVSACFWIPWAAVLASQTRRSERDFPALAWTQVGSAAAGAAVIIVGQLCWVTAAFRPERAADEIRLLSDLGFILTIMPFAIFVVWNVALALAIFGDRRPQPAYPRWSAYLCLWTAFLYVPGGALAFFQDGPFAWNGALAFFLPAIAFFVWIIVMTYLGIQAIARQSATPVREPAPQPEMLRVPVGVA